MAVSPPPIHIWLKEAILNFYDKLPSGVADITIQENLSPTVFEAEIKPKMPGAAPIKVIAEEGDLEAIIAFGEECQTEARYYPKQSMADVKFREEVLSICKTIATNEWQEKIFLQGKEIVKTEALLPLPIGRIRVVGYKPLSFRFLFKKTERTITWKPYWESVGT